jgi:hypothetical protein
MANPENIKPFEFKKGESGNPKGRPKGARGRAVIVREWLEVNENALNFITGEKENLTQAEIATLAMIQKARNGDVNAYCVLMDSAYGKNPDRVIDETNAPKKLVIVVTDGDVETGEALED